MSNQINFCLKCNKQFSRLKGHVERIHGLTMSQYCELFPEHIANTAKARAAKNEKISKKMVGKTVSQITKERMSKSAVDRHSNNTEEDIAAMRKRAQMARLAKGNSFKHTEETKKQMSVSAKMRKK